MEAPGTRITHPLSDTNPVIVQSGQLSAPPHSSHPLPMPGGSLLQATNESGKIIFPTIPTSGQLPFLDERTTTANLALNQAPHIVTGNLITIDLPGPEKPGSLTVIRPPVPRKKVKKPTRQPRRPMMLLSIVSVCLATLLLALLIANPLGRAMQSGGIQQSINTFLSNGPLTSLSPERHLITPSPVPPSLIDEGKCGDASIWGTCAGETTVSGVIGTGQMESPLKGEGASISQDFGLPEYQYWCGCYRPHSGIDLAAPYDTPIKAADSGEVIWVGWDDTGLGYGVKISHGNYVATIYGHMYRYIVEVGTVVQKGDIIGYVGSTGQSTGPHVHFMFLVYNRWVNPIEHMVLP
jgi:hypothetical protein